MLAQSAAAATTIVRVSATEGTEENLHRRPFLSCGLTEKTKKDWHRRPQRSQRGIAATTRRGVGVPACRRARRLHSRRGNAQKAAKNTKTDQELSLRYNHWVDPFCERDLRAAYLLVIYWLRAGRESPRDSLRASRYPPASPLAPAQMTTGRESLARWCCLPLFATFVASVQILFFLQSK
jgi:hypothetical protein